MFLIILVLSRYCSVIDLTVIGFILEYCCGLMCALFVDIIGFGVDKWYNLFGHHCRCRAHLTHLAVLQDVRFTVGMPYECMCLRKTDKSESRPILGPNNKLFCTRFLIFIEPSFHHERCVLRMCDEASIFSSAHSFLMFQFDKRCASFQIFSKIDGFINLIC